MKLFTISFFYLTFFFIQKNTSAQISDSIHSLNDDGWEKIYVDTTSAISWKIIHTCFYRDSNKIKSIGEGIIIPKTKEIFYIFKKESIFFESGIKKHEFYIKNNLKDSIETFWYEDGNIQSITNWVNGKKNGRYISWYDTGKIKEIGYFINDDPSYERIRFSPYDDIKNSSFSINHYENGSLLFTEEYRKNGSLQQEIYYNESETIIKDYYNNGILRSIQIRKKPLYVFEDEITIKKYYREDGTIESIHLTEKGRISIQEFDKEGKEIDWSNSEERKNRLLKQKN